MSAQWEGVLTLKRLDQTGEARKAAISLLAKTGQLPGARAECKQVLKLFAAKSRPWVETAATTVAKKFGDWWWLIAVVVALGALPLTARRLRRPSARASRSKPNSKRFAPVRIMLTDAREAATGQTVGARFTATVYAQMLQLNSNQLGTGIVNITDSSDALTSPIPLDALPEQAHWFVKLGQWLRACNHLTAQFTLAAPRPGRVCVVPEILEPTGGLTQAPEHHDLRDVIERRSTTADAADYLRLTPAVFAWVLYSAKTILGQADGLAAEVGTSYWDAYAHFLEGTACVRAGEHDAALTHFRVSREIDPTDLFWERRLNEAFAYAMSDDAADWEVAYALLDFLVSGGA